MKEESVSKGAVLSGPMFEPAESDLWKSVSGKSGAHYNTFGCSDANGMAALRRMFPSGEANDLNFCLFSTSGVHGTYQTIEEAEKELKSGDADAFTSVTFLLVHPRICCLRYGNCQPTTDDDFAFLKRLRKTSWKAAASIGKHS